MKYELTDVEPIAGYAAHSAAEGQEALMVVSAFLTPDGTSTFYHDHGGAPALRVDLGYVSQRFR
jgi:hypothetical protein